MRHLVGFSYCLVITAITFALWSPRCLDAQSSIPKEVPTGYFYMTLPIPQQTLMCDLAGIGRITRSAVDKVEIAPEQFWLGNVTTNPVKIWYNMERIGSLPSTNSMVVFFATTNLWWTLLGSTNFPASRCLYSFDFVTTPPAAHACTSTNWTTINDLSSIIPVSDVNTNVYVFASNLVHAARVSRDSDLFYSLVQNGATNATTQIAQDSRDFVFFRRTYLPSNVVTFVDSVIEQAIRNRQQ